MKSNMIDSSNKSKDLKKSIKRLFRELKSYRFIIIFATVLAILSSIIAIITPRRISKLTDEISKGLIPDNTAVKKLTEKVVNNINSGNISSIKVNGYTITFEEQLKYLKILNGLSKDDKENDLRKSIKALPESIGNVISPKMDDKKILDISLILVLLYVLSSVFSYIQTIIMLKTGNKFAYHLREKISSKINKLPLNYYDKNQSGDILSRVTNDIDNISSAISQSSTTLVSSIVMILSAVFMMFYTNWILAISAILSSIIGFVFMVFVMKNSQKYFVQKQEELGKLNGHIEEVYSNLNVVKAYNGEKEVQKIFTKHNDILKRSNQKSQFLSGLMMPMMMFIGNFGFVVVTIVGSLLAFKGVITFGVIIAFIMYVRLFTNPMAQIAQGLTYLQSVAASSERVFEFLDSEEMSQDVKTLKDLSKVKGHIEFKNVSFKYPDNKNLTIKNFTAKAKPGDKIAIVGPTGAGKTTMVNLLMKFYDITDGDILIDGISIKEISRSDLRNLFTMVLQDTWLFEGTVKENIIYNRKGINDEEVYEICKTIELDHFIKTLPNSYDTLINESDQISQGQKQLITIARSLLNSSPIIILDEATSNVDTRTEELVQKSMDKLTENKTSFIIAHRLSTIKNADLILVMKDGNIIEQGTHNKLMNKKGFYYELYSSQFKL